MAKLFRVRFWLSAGGCMLSLAAVAQAQTTSEDAHRDWPRIVPGDVHFYAEIRDLRGIREQFRRLGIWDLVRELSRPPAPGATSRPWQHDAEETLGMTADAAITEVLGDHCALVASEPAKWQDGILLAELKSAEDAAALVKRWAAKKLPAEEKTIDRYMLRGGLLLAISDRWLAFGPAGDPEGLWARTVLLMSGRRGPALAGRSEFASLRARLGESHQGVLYVAWPEGDPTAVAGCSRLLMGVSVTATQISCELHGQRNSPVSSPPADGLKRIGEYPSNTMAVWSAGYDFSDIARRAKEGTLDSGDSLLGFFLAAFSSFDTQTAQSVHSLGPPYQIVVGPPDAGAEFQLPSITAVCAVRGGADHIAKLDQVLSLISEISDAIATPAGETVPEAKISRETVEGVELHWLSVGPTLARRLNLPMLKRVELCWGLLDERLLLSSSRAHVREIVLAARGKAERLETALRSGQFASPREWSAELAECLLVRGNVLARVFEHWIGYLQRENPEALDKYFWQKWARQRVEQRLRLGVGLAPDPGHRRRAVVREISTDSPARGILLQGDVIVGAAGRTLTSSQPAEEVASRYRNRGGAQQFAIRLLRAGEMMDVAIPVLPADAGQFGDFDPIRAINQWIVLLRRVEMVSLNRFATKPDRYDARVQIRWEQ